MSIGKDPRCGNTGGSLRKESEQTEPNSEHSADQPRFLSLEQHAALDRAAQPFDLSEEQQAALDDIEWLLADPKRQLVIVEGFAGVGKSTLIARIPEVYSGNVEFAGPTAKSVIVMRQRGCEGATTLHALLYDAPANITDLNGGRLLRWLLRHNAFFDLVAVDEASMVNHELAQHLQQRAKKIVVVLDGEQLPPVNGYAAFTAEPDVFLSEIHRQAAGSPVIKLATEVRNGGEPKRVKYDRQLLLDADIVLCATNDLRGHYNKVIRSKRGFKGPLPMIGEQVCCLRNSHGRGLTNGVVYSVGAIVELDEDVVVLRLLDDEGLDYEALVPKVCFERQINPHSIDRDLDAFDYGYVLTVHKAQGSEWPRVCILDGSNSRAFHYMRGELGLTEFRRRWLYTAITRASERVDLVEMS